MWNSQDGIEQEKKPVAEYIFWVYLISWTTIAIIILLEHMNLFQGRLEKGIVMILIVVGAGLAPAYSTFIILRKHNKINGMKDYWNCMIRCTNIKITVAALLSIFFHFLCIRLHLGFL